MGNPGRVQAVVEFSSPVGGAGAGFAYRTIPGTAIAGDDYLPLDRRMIFAPGETHTLIDVPVVGDDEIEGDQYFDLVIDGIEGAIPGASPLQLRILLLNDDNALEPEPEPEPDPTPLPDDCDVRFHRLGHGIRTCR